MAQFSSLASLEFKPAFSNVCSLRWVWRISTSHLLSMMALRASWHVIKLWQRLKTTITWILHSIYKIKPHGIMVIPIKSILPKMPCNGEFIARGFKPYSELSFKHFQRLFKVTVRSSWPIWVYMFVLKPNTALGSISFDVLNHLSQHCNVISHIHRDGSIAFCSNIATDCPSNCYVGPTIHLSAGSCHSSYSWETNINS